MSVKYYVINLDKYPEKLERCLQSFKKVEIFPEKFSAVVGKDLSPEIIGSITTPHVQHTLNTGRSQDNDISTKGMIGCYLSHTKIWKKVVDENIDYCFIFEDDAIPIASSSKIQKFLLEIPKDWDFVFLGFTIPGFYENNDVLVGNDILKVNSILFGAHAYIISNSGAKKLLSKAFPISDQVDNYFSYMFMYNNVNAYRPTRSLFEQQNLEGSSLQDDCLKCKINRFSNTTIAMLIAIVVIIFFVFFILMCQCLYKNIN
jgi:glycosyl transferase family 25